MNIKENEEQRPQRITQLSTVSTPTLLHFMFLSLLLWWRKFKQLKVTGAVRAGTVSYYLTIKKVQHNLKVTLNLNVMFQIHHFLFITIVTVLGLWSRVLSFGLLLQNSSY